MGFETLQEKITKSFRNLQGKGHLTAKNMEDTLQEIRIALLEADVNYRVAKDFLDEVRTKALGHDVLNAVDPGEQLVKIVHDELIVLLGSEDNSLKLKPHGLSIIMVVGLQGTGKTTHVAKIAKLLKTKQNRRPLLIAADNIRPAAVEQLETLGESIAVPVYKEELNKPALTIAQDGIAYADKAGYDTVLIDTAGRLHIDDALMAELKGMKDALNPDEILLTVDALTGQDIVNVAEAFDKLLAITGLIVTKFDGDAKGGAVLSVKSITGVPIKFTGIGEKVDDLEIFHPDRLAQRILGMGDVVSLVEKAQEQFDEKKAKRSAERLAKGKFTMDDLLEQLEALQKMGPVAGIVRMLPGMGDIAKSLEGSNADYEFVRIKAIIQSMTPYERANPDVIRGTHKRRIAAGSGTKVDDVNRLLSRYSKMNQMMKQLGAMRSFRRMH